MSPHLVERKIIIRRVLPVTIIGISIAVLISLFFMATQRMNHLRQAPSDNVTWTLSQAEVDLLTLIEEVKISQNEDKTTFKDLHRRFNAFHSRVTNIAESPVFASMRADPTFLEQLGKLLNCLEFTTPLIDTNDTDLRENLPFILLGLSGVRSDVHDIALTGIALQSEVSDTERESFSKVLAFAAIVSLALILFLIFMLFFLLRQYRLHRGITDQVNRANMRLKSSFQVSLDAIIVVDDTGLILDFNTSAETVFGFSRSEAIGKQMAELIIPRQNRKAHYAGMTRFNKTQEARLVGKGRIEVTALRKSGEEFPVEISIGQAQDHRGTIFISYLRDITERIAAEENLKAARDEALKAEKSKSNFLAVMSHEMRTPLNGLFGTMELLQKTSLTKKQNEYVDVARRSGRILLHHVNDVLDVSRLDENKLELRESDFDLTRFFQDVVSSNDAIAAKQGNKLELNILQVPKANVIMDEQRLRQIIYNLVSNALKFTNGGKVIINVNTVTKTHTGNELHFNVTDNGIGIPAEEQALIFNRFYTKEKTYDRMASGAGLGLTICKQIVELMGGEISVSSEKDGETVFSVVLPFAVAEETAEITPESKDHLEHIDLRGHEILLVEDNEINRMIVREMLHSEGLIVTEALDGQHAVEIAKKQPFSAILMDISMPIMNGVDATMIIRGSENPNQKTPILALTAHAIADEQSRFLEAGMDSCLNKPVSQATLLQALSKAVHGQTANNNTKNSLETRTNLVDEEIFGNLKNVLSEEKIVKLIVGFETEINSLLETIPSLLNSDNMAELARESHNSVGSAGMIGLLSFQADLRQLEQAAKSENLSGAESAAPIVSENWARSRDALRASVSTYPLA